MNRGKRVLNAGVLASWRWIERIGEVVPGTRLGDDFGHLGKGSAIGFPAATLMNVGSIHIGAQTLIGRQVTLSAGYGPADANISDRALVIGDRCVIGARCSLTAHSSITLGDDVWCGQDVFISDAGHGYQELHTPIGQQLGLHHPVIIGNGAWIGHGAVILPGTSIGANAIVAAGAVVRGVVEERAIVGGSPARVLRTFEPGVGWVTSGGDIRPILPPLVEQ